MDSSIFSLLILGFGLGSMHALDADHVMAITALNNGKQANNWRILRFAMTWAVGHGVVLLTAGVLLWSFGWAIPQSLQVMAELSVGVLLIGAGAWFFVKAYKQRLSLASHHHGDVEHSHWHHEGDANSGGHGEKGHQPLLVGFLHGLAGSAPALALVPAFAQGGDLPALFYLLMFSLGVMLAMVTACMSWRMVQHGLNKYHRKAYLWSRQVIAVGAIGMGFYWLGQAV